MFKQEHIYTKNIKANGAVKRNGRYSLKLKEVTYAYREWPHQEDIASPHSQKWGGKQRMVYKLIDLKK
jgi:hypothetical protein